MLLDIINLFDNKNKKIYNEFVGIGTDFTESVPIPTSKNKYGETDEKKNFYNNVNNIYNNCKSDFV